MNGWNVLDPVAYHEVFGREKKKSEHLFCSAGPTSGFLGIWVSKSLRESVMHSNYA